MLALYEDGMFMFAKENGDTLDLNGREVEYCAFAMGHILCSVPDGLQYHPLLWQVGNISTGNTYQTKITLKLIAGRKHTTWDEINLYLSSE